jgi:hypothetical protein
MNFKTFAILFILLVLASCASNRNVGTVQDKPMPQEEAAGRSR